MRIDGRWKMSNVGRTVTSNWFSRTRIPRRVPRQTYKEVQSISVMAARRSSTARTVRERPPHFFADRFESRCESVKRISQEVNRRLSRSDFAIGSVRFFFSRQILHTCEHNRVREYANSSFPIFYHRLESISRDILVRR